MGKKSNDIEEMYIEDTQAESAEMSAESDTSETAQAEASEEVGAVEAPEQAEASEEVGAVEAPEQAEASEEVGAVEAPEQAEASEEVGAAEAPAQAEGAEKAENPHRKKVDWKAYGITDFDKVHRRMEKKERERVVSLDDRTRTADDKQAPSGKSKP